MKVKTEADINDISAECSHDDKPAVGMFVLSEVLFYAHPSYPSLVVSMI